MEEEKTCSVCGKKITGEALHAGYLSEKDGKFMCSACLEEFHRRRAENVKGVSSANAEITEILKGILEELKAINNHITFKEFSIWNVFGGIAQAFVFFLLFLAIKSGASHSYLAAVAVQLMALTFFILARK